MKVAITGASGHLGGLIVHELHRRQHLIQALTRSSPGAIFSHIPIVWIEGDLENQDSLEQLMESCDALIHCAGFISLKGNPGGLVQKTNVAGTRNVMHAARKCGIKRVIHISSIHAFDQHPVNKPLDESHTLVTNKGFAYDHSKKESQQIALSFASNTMDVLVMNPTSIISPFDYKPSKIGKAIIELSTGKLPFIVRGGFDFCDGRDVSHAIVNALTMGTNGHCYLLSGKWHSLAYVASTLSSISGKKIKPIEMPLASAWIGLPFILLYARFKKEEPKFTNESLVAIRDGNKYISSEKAKKELNFTIRPLNETLRDTWIWFKENGYLD